MDALGGRLSMSARNAGTLRQTLQLAEDLTLPLEAVTQTFAVLGMRGSGKSYTGMVLAEEMVAAGLHVVIIDPLDVFWGLRAGADGSPSGGLPIVGFGGPQGD